MAIQLQGKAEEVVVLERRRKEEGEESRRGAEGEKWRWEEERRRLEEEMRRMEEKLEQFATVEEECSRLRGEVQREEERIRGLEEEMRRGKEEREVLEEEHKRRLGQVVEEREREQLTQRLEWEGRCADLGTQLELGSVAREDLEQQVSTHRASAGSLDHYHALPTSSGVTAGAGCKRPG